jgi:hypothetical protein
MVRSSRRSNETDALGTRRRTLSGLLWLGGIVLATFGVLLAPYLRHGYRFGIGSDMPVYLWWTRVGASEGLSAVGGRPGSPALIAVVAGSLHLSVVSVAAGFVAALGAGIAAGMAMLVRAAMPMGGERRGARAAWVVGGLLTGLFTVHLAAGYVANLAFAAPFVAAAVCLATRTRRGAYAAALALGGGGLAHPQFFLVGMVILAGVAVWSLVRHERGWSSDAGRATIAALGGGALLAAGLASLTAGPTRLGGDTSKDGFLRRAGRLDALSTEYVDRFLRRWARYVQWLSVPVAALGFMRTSGTARRVLATWSALVVVGAPLGLLTGLYPADRLITFGFAIPALAGVGVVGVRNWFGSRRLLGTVVATALVGVMAAGALMAWSRQSTFMSTLEVEHVTMAGRIADATSTAGAPLVFIVDDTDATASFLATRAMNVIRASVPPDRAADVYVYVGTPRNYFAGTATQRGNPEFDALSRLYLSDIPTGPTTVFLLTSFDRDLEAIHTHGLYSWNGGVYSSESPAETGPLDPARDPLVPSSPWWTIDAAIAILALTGAVGYAWARWAGLDTLAAVATAPAFGAVTLILGGMLADLIGLSLDGSVGPTIVALGAGATGVVLLIAQGQPPAPAPVTVEEQPAE